MHAVLWHDPEPPARMTGRLDRHWFRRQQSSFYNINYYYYYRWELGRPLRFDTVTLIYQATERRPSEKYITRLFLR